MTNRRQVAKTLGWRIGRIPQVKETYLPQGMDLPQLSIEVDRVAAARLKLTQTDIVRNVITALMSSAQLAPNFWIDPTTGNPYIIGVQYPEYLVDNVQTLENVPLSAERNRGTKRTPLLRDVATIHRNQGPVEVFHYEADRVSQLLVSVGDNDLARVANEIDRVVAQLPLTYALTNLPLEALLAHAIKVFPREHGDPAVNLDLQHLLTSYFRDEDPEVALELREEYGVDVNTLNLAKDEHFRERLDHYMNLTKGQIPARVAMQQEFGVDPEPLRSPAESASRFEAKSPACASRSAKWASICSWPSCWSIW